MPLKSALVVGLVAAAACAGCATGPGYVATSSWEAWAAEGMASPWSDDVRQSYRFGGCSGGGTYNRASGLCVSEGVE
jgi:hypothetical protein